MNPNEIEDKAAKVISAWALIGITSWADVAAFLGALYTAALLSEWLWKKVKPTFIARGWIADRRGPHTRKTDNE